MSRYTMTIQEITNNGVDIFNGWTFPIFDEAYREPLKEKIKRHYYFREIGVETVGQFVYNLNTRLNEVMPVFNKMYMAQSLDQRILDNYELTEIYTRSIDNESTQEENAANNNKQLKSDTPQGRLNITDGSYVSEIVEDSASTDNTTTASGKTQEEYTLTRKGNIGVQTDANAVTQFIQSLRNVDLEIINSLHDLFMQVY